MTTMPWNTINPPSSSRQVLVLYRRSDIQIKPRVIVGIYGSESKWLALDHDQRLTYLEQGAVLGWQELPEVLREVG